MPTCPEIADSEVIERRLDGFACDAQDAAHLVDCAPCASREDRLREELAVLIDGAALALSREVAASPVARALRWRLVAAAAIVLLAVGLFFANGGGPAREVRGGVGDE